MSRRVLGIASWAICLLLSGAILRGAELVEEVGHHGALPNLPAMMPGAPGVWPMPQLGMPFVPMVPETGVPEYRLEIICPLDAKILINHRPMTVSGTHRVFRLPVIGAGGTLQYEVCATYDRNSASMIGMIPPDATPNAGTNLPTITATKTVFLTPGVPVVLLVYGCELICPKEQGKKAASPCKKEGDGHCNAVVDEKRIRWEAELDKKIQKLDETLDSITRQQSELTKIVNECCRRVETHLGWLIAAIIVGHAISIAFCCVWRSRLSASESQDLTRTLLNRVVELEKKLEEKK